MPNQETLYHVADRVATITLNRPDKLNAWTAVMEREVRAAMGQAEHDENVRVIIVPSVRSKSALDFFRISTTAPPSSKENANAPMNGRRC